MKLGCLIFLELFYYVVAFEFADPQQPGVTFGNQTTTSQKIFVDEKNSDGTPETIKFVLITGVQGNITIVGNTYSNLLDVKIIDGEDDNQKYAEVNRVDYEVLMRGGRTTFPIDIIANNDISSKKTISLTINNVDDESPTLSTTNNCIMDENTKYLIDDVSDNPCSFTIQDPDGFLSGMDFTAITGNDGESDLFEFRYKEVPNDNIYDTEVYLLLKDDQTLDYEKKTLYVFHVEAKDAAGHSTTPVSSVPITVQVLDQPDENPIWDSSFVSAVSLVEEMETTISVSAIDGDFGINNEINYSVEEIENAGFVSIDAKTGLITIDKIDRDKGYDQIVFEVTAFEVPDPSANITGRVTVFIQDIDDNVPLITMADGSKSVEIKVDENTAYLDVYFQVSDIDKGENAMYSAVLKPVGDVDHTAAFSIVPERGYENSTLFLTVTDSTKLDYENTDWIEIQMELQTVGVKNKSLTDTFPISITLQDVNDEIPVFDPAEIEVTIKENVPKGKLIYSITATDSDAEDVKIKHTILDQAANKILSIEEFGGNITTIVDNAFDFEKQKQLIVYIQAEDNAASPHRSTFRLTINIEDVDDE